MKLYGYQNEALLTYKQANYTLGLKHAGEHTPDKHGTDGEDLLSVCVGTDVSEPDASQTAQCEVERCDVGAAQRWAANCTIRVRSLQTLAQLL